jgi:hypothetical protein
MEGLLIGIPLFFMLAIPVVIVLVVVAIIHSRRKAKERREAMAAWAAKRRLYFHADKVQGFDREYPLFGCLRRGSNRYALNIIGGKLEGYEMKLFDYHYETTSTDSEGNTTTHTHLFSGVIVEPPFATRQIVIRPEGVFDKVKAAFGWDDINFESAEFSRRYYVACEDKRWAYDVIHGKIMDLLLKARKYTIEGDGQAMMIRMGESRFDLAGFERAFGVLAKILREIPEHAKERAEQGVL